MEQEEWVKVTAGQEKFLRFRLVELDLYAMHQDS